MSKRAFYEVVADLVFGRPGFTGSGLSAEQYVAACGWEGASEADVVDAVNILGIGDKSFSTGGNVLSLGTQMGAAQYSPVMAAGPAGGMGPAAGAGAAAVYHAPVQPQVMQTINHYAQFVHTEDNDTVVDSSVNTVIQADPFSSVYVDVDNDTATASGDGAVAANGNVNGVATGDGAVAAGRDISDSAVNTGEFTGAQVGEFDGDNLVSTVGDGNISAGDDITDTNIAQDGSSITSINDSENVAFGDGSSVDDSINQTQNIDQTQVMVDQDIDQDNDGLDVDLGGRLVPGGFGRPDSFEFDADHQSQSAAGSFFASEGPEGDTAAFDGFAHQDQDSTEVEIDD